MLSSSTPGGASACRKSNVGHGRWASVLLAFAAFTHASGARAESAAPGPSSEAPAATPAAPVPASPAEAAVRYSLAGPVGTPDAAAVKEAKHAEKDGKTAVRAGDYAGALALYRRAYGLTGSEGALAAAAECHEHLGQLVEAHDLVAALLQKYPEGPAREARTKKLAELAGRTAVLTLDAESGAAVEVDGHAVDTGAGGLRLLPGEHRVHVTRAERIPFDSSVTLEAGASQPLAVKLASIVKASPAEDRGEVRDFCFMKIPKDTSRYQKQRVVLFGLAGEGVINGPEGEENEKGETVKGAQHHVLSELGFHSHGRNVFLSTFPMDRFFIVNALVDSPEGLQKRPFVSDTDMIKAAAVDTYAAYSIACADWVGMPRVTEKSATWKRVKKQRIVNGKSVDYMAWDLAIVWGLEADAYHHEKDGWHLVQTVSGSNGGLFGVALGLAALAPQKGNTPDQLISKRPAPSCSVPLLPSLKKFTDGVSECETKANEVRTGVAAVVSGGSGEKPTEGPSAEAVGAAVGQAAAEAAEGNTRQAVEAAAAGTGETGAAAVKAVVTTEAAINACKKPIEAIADAKDELRALSSNPTQAAFGAAVGLAACAGVDFTADLSTATAPGAAQLHSSFCENVQDDVARGPQAMRDVATCRGRVGMEGATLMLQKNLKGIPGFRMMATVRRLQEYPDGNVVGIALGHDEGLKRGDLYVAFTKGPDGASERVGYGRILLVGPGGRDGTDKPSHFKPRAGSAPDGARIEEHPQVGVPLALRPQVDFFVSRGALKSTMAFGGALEGGYNATDFVPIGDEVWGKAFVGYAQGTDKESFVTVELVPEILHYLGGGFAVYGTSGFTMVVALKEIPQGAVVNGKTVAKDTSVAGLNLGAELGGGLDYSIAPDWNARISATYRQGFYGTKLEESTKTVSVDAGLLSLAQGGVSVGYTF